METATQVQGKTGLNRHKVVVINCIFFIYNIHNGILYKYPLHYLVGDRQEERKYLVRDEKVYGVKPKFQENWMNRLRHVNPVSINIIYIYIYISVWARTDVTCQDETNSVVTNAPGSSTRGNGKPKTTAVNLLMIKTTYI